MKPTANEHHQAAFYYVKPRSLLPQDITSWNLNLALFPQEEHEINKQEKILDWLILDQSVRKRVRATATETMRQTCL
ncbi:hypothetical protein F8388_003839 [Cannabis sativa]|uniref:Uncharacterized protein n=1 Tax=Cannabis sativa TaxID=3483 RepID=A0A7J6GNP5_CANSA|nr:hypothetical protein F8388_003839 [Cannabis sativa]